MIYENEELNEEVFVRIFKSITDFQKSNLVVVSRIWRDDSAYY